MQFLSILTTALSLVYSLVTHVEAWTNPIRNPGGSDPFLVYSGDGYYYLLTTTWTDVEISRATTITELKASPETKTVFSTTTASMCCNVWSPEVHYLGDKWYIYFTAGDASDLDGQRLHVLEGRPDLSNALARRNDCSLTTLLYLRRLDAVGRLHLHQPAHHRMVH